jgi:hypothetical protein
MIEPDQQPETDLREAVRVATRHAVDTYRAEGVLELAKLPREEFYARCHEGFGLAQDLILKNLLQLEKQLKELRETIRQQSKGKKDSEVRRDEGLQKVMREARRIDGVATAFRRVADTIAWQILGMNKTLMRSTHTDHGTHGYLSDTNIQSAVEAIAQLRKPGEFYLINDLTLCLGSGVGDLLRVGADRSIGFIEVKTGAENVRIADFMHAYGDQAAQQVGRDSPPRPTTLATRQH